MMGIFLVLVQFLQAVAGYSALQRRGRPVADGGGDDAALDDGADDRQADRRSARRCSIGAALFATGLALLATMVSVDGGYWSILPGLLVLGAGIGLLMSPSTTAITESLPEEHQGVASALNDTVREFGGAVGIALARLGGQRRLPLVGQQRRPATCRPQLAQRVEDGIGSAYAASGRARHRRRRRCSTPPATRWSTDGSCRCGSASRWRRPCSCSSSSAAPPAATERRRLPTVDDPPR